MLLPPSPLPTRSILWPFPSPRPITKPPPVTRLHLRKQNKRQNPLAGTSLYLGTHPHVSQGPWTAAGSGLGLPAGSRLHRPTLPPLLGRCQSRGERGEGGRVERGERSRYTSWAAHTINRSGCKRLPKHLLRVPAGISMESPAAPRSSSQLSPALSETRWGCRRVRTPRKQLLGSSWLQPLGLGPALGLCSIPTGLAGARPEAGTHRPRPAARAGTWVSTEPLYIGDGGGGGIENTQT